LKVPAKLVPVPRELLEALASEAGASTPSGTPAPADGPRLVVPRYLAHFGREFRERKGNKWELAVCPFHPDHGGKDCIIGQKPSGAVWFRCLHNRCTGKRWQDVKRIIGEPLPEHYDPPLGNRKQERKPVEVIRFSEVKLVPVEYDWENVLARRKLTLFAGMMDTGKSLLTAYVASRYSKRRTFPCGNRARLGTSVLLGVEDDHADTVGPRLVAAGADLRRVVTVKSLGSLNRDLDLLEKTIKDLGDVVYLSFDPLSFYLDGVDLHRDNEIRGVLGRLVEMTRQYDITVSAVHHLTKKEDVAALHRLTGSAGIPAIARFVWFVVKDKLDPDRRLFLRGKGNLTAANIPGQSFRISAAELRADDGRVIETARIGWEPGTVNADPNEYLIGGREPADRRQERNDARQWLHDLLKDGPVPVRQVLQAAANNGHSPRTVRRAADELKVEKPSKGHGPGTVTSWKLPE